MDKAAKNQFVGMVRLDRQAIDRIARLIVEETGSDHPFGIALAGAVIGAVVLEAELTQNDAELEELLHRIADLAFKTLQSIHTVETHPGEITKEIESSFERDESRFSIKSALVKTKRGSVPKNPFEGEGESATAPTGHGRTSHGLFDDE